MVQDVTELDVPEKETSKSIVVNAVLEQERNSVKPSSATTSSRPGAKVAKVKLPNAVPVAISTAHVELMVVSAPITVNSKSYTPAFEAEML